MLRYINFSPRLFYEALVSEPDDRDGLLEEYGLTDEPDKPRSNIFDWLDGILNTLNHAIAVRRVFGPRHQERLGRVIFRVKREVSEPLDLSAVYSCIMRACYEDLPDAGPGAKYAAYALRDDGSLAGRWNLP